MQSCYVLTILYAAFHICFFCLCQSRQGFLAGVCSGYLDVGTTFNRLVYVVRLLTHNGFYVLLDNQFNLDTSVLDNQNQWLSDWTTLLRAIAQDPVSSQRLMIDVLNVCFSACTLPLYQSICAKHSCLPACNRAMLVPSFLDSICRRPHMLLCMFHAANACEVKCMSTSPPPPSSTTSSHVHLCHKRDVQLCSVHVSAW